MQLKWASVLPERQNSKKRPWRELSIYFSKSWSGGSTHPSEGNQCKTLISTDKTVQKEKKTKIESGASYNRNQSARGMQHSRAAHCLSQTTVSATFHWGVHVQMFITLQLQPAWAPRQEAAHACWQCKHFFSAHGCQPELPLHAQGEGLLACQQQSGSVPHQAGYEKPEWTQNILTCICYGKPAGRLTCP